MAPLKPTWPDAELSGTFYFKIRLKKLFPIRKSAMFNTVLRVSASRVSLLKSIHTTAISRLREVVVEKPDSKTTVIEARYVKSPRTPYLLKADPSNEKCILCKLKLDIKHTDVLILSQFINTKGELLERKEVGLCIEQYRLIKNLIYMAQHAGLLPEPPRLRPKKPYDYLNTYYDEKTINLRRRKKIYPNKLYYLQLGPIEKLRVKPDKGIGW